MDFQLCTVSELIQPIIKNYSVKKNKKELVLKLKQKCKTRKSQNF